MQSSKEKLKKHFLKIRKIKNKNEPIFIACIEARDFLEDEMHDLVEKVIKKYKIDAIVYQTFKLSPSETSMILDASFNRDLGLVCVHLKNGITKSYKIKNIDVAFDQLKIADFSKIDGFVAYVLLATEYIDAILMHGAFRE